MSGTLIRKFHPGHPHGKVNAAMTAVASGIAGDAALYRQLSAHALADAAQQLNWEVWGRQVALAIGTRLGHGTTNGGFNG